MSVERPHNGELALILVDEQLQSLYRRLWTVLRLVLLSDRTFSRVVWGATLRTSIIVPVYQQADILSHFIDSLVRTIEPGTEVIFVNDGSGPAAAAVLEDAKLKLEATGCSATILTNDSLRGCGQSLNRGLEAATGDLLVFADSDLMLEPGWQQSLTDTLELPAPSTGERAGMAASVLLYPQTGGVQHAGVRFSESSGRHWKLNAKPEDLGSAVFEVQIAAFALFAMSRDVFEEVGLVDEAYLNGYEDFDFQLRARQRGYRTLIDPNHRSYHWERKNGPHRATNRKSNLARLWRQWGSELEDDLTEEIANAIVTGANSNGASCVVDLAESRIDVRLVREAVFLSNETLVWADKSASIGDGEDVTLPVVSNEDSFATGKPLVILVENFVQVASNHYWLRWRQNLGISDVFVDLNGNVLAAEDLARMSYPGRRLR